MNEAESAKQQWIYDQQGLLIVLGPLEVSTKAKENEVIYTFKRPVLWRRSEGDSGPEPTGSRQDSADRAGESN